MSATDKQKNYIRALVRKAGVSMQSAVSELGDAPFSLMNSPIEDWIEMLDVSEASKVIDWLKEELGE